MDSSKLSEVERKSYLLLAEMRERLARHIPAVERIKIAFYLNRGRSPVLKPDRRARDLVSILDSDRDRHWIFQMSGSSETSIVTLKALVNGMLPHCALAIDDEAFPPPYDDAEHGMSWASPIRWILNVHYLDSPEFARRIWLNASESIDPTTGEERPALGETFPACSAHERRELHELHDHDEQWEAMGFFQVDAVHVFIALADFALGSFEMTMQSSAEEAKQSPGRRVEPLSAAEMNRACRVLGGTMKRPAQQPRALTDYTKASSFLELGISGSYLGNRKSVLNTAKSTKIRTRPWIKPDGQPHGKILEWNIGDVLAELPERVRTHFSEFDAKHGLSLIQKISANRAS